MAVGCGEEGNKTGFMYTVVEGSLIMTSPHQAFEESEYTGFMRERSTASRAKLQICNLEGSALMASRPDFKERR